MQNLRVGIVIFIAEVCTKYPTSCDDLNIFSFSNLATVACWRGWVSEWIDDGNIPKICLIQTSIVVMTIMFQINLNYGCISPRCHVVPTVSVEDFGLSNSLFVRDSIIKVDDTFGSGLGHVRHRRRIFSVG